MKYSSFLYQQLNITAPQKTENKANDVIESKQPPKNSDAESGERKRIGVLDTEPTRIGAAPDGLTPQQQELREAVIKRFTLNSVTKYITEQINHINNKQQLTEKISILFDENGKPPANAPLEDIVRVREQIESEMHMLEAIYYAMDVHLSEIKEIEDAAMELVKHRSER